MQFCKPLPSPYHPLVLSFYALNNDDTFARSLLHCFYDRNSLITSFSLNFHFHLLKLLKTYSNILAFSTCPAFSFPHHYLLKPYHSLVFSFPFPSYLHSSIILPLLFILFTHLSYSVTLLSSSFFIFQSVFYYLLFFYFFIYCSFILILSKRHSILSNLLFFLSPHLSRCILLMWLLSSLHQFLLLTVSPSISFLCILSSSTMSFSELSRLLFLSPHLFPSFLAYF